MHVSFETLEYSRSSVGVAEDMSVNELLSCVSLLQIVLQMVRGELLFEVESCGLK